MSNGVTAAAMAALEGWDCFVFRHASQCTQQHQRNHYLAEYSPGAEDIEVLALAAREERTVLTFDRDYGELIYRSDLPAPDAVVCFRLSSAAPEEPAERLLWLLYTSGLSVEGKFTLVERERVR